MKKKLFNTFSFIIILLLITLSYCENNKEGYAKGKCIYMIGDSKAFNFNYLKSERGENK